MLGSVSDQKMWHGSGFVRRPDFEAVEEERAA